MVTGTSDLFVRYLLGLKENTPLLVDFINAVLTDSGFETIENASIQNPFNINSLSIEKETILDIKAVSKSNKTFDIEIQNHPENSYIKRSLYYWAQLYSSQLDKGNPYKELQPVICINLLAHSLFKGSKKGHTCFLVTEKDDKDSILTDDLQINYLELPKFSDSYDINNRLGLWAWFFRYEGIAEKEEEMEFLLKQDPIIKEAHNIYTSFTEDRKLRELSEAREKRLRDEASRLDSAKQAGKEELISNLKKLGVPIETISKAAELSMEEIKKL